MSGLVTWLDRKFYPDFEDHWDDMLFRKAIKEHLTAQSMVLDVGAGAGIVEHMHFRGEVARVCGVDLDPRVVGNPYLDEGRITDARSIPYDDDTFDIAFANNVMEHLEDPQAVLSEIRRTLKPGGVLLFKTPNRNHYMPLIARLTTHRFHQFYNRLRGRDACDTFPTRYLANSRKQILCLARQTEMKVIGIRAIEGRPEYLRHAVPTYLLGLAYERLVNSFALLSRFRVLLIATLRKPS